MRTILKFWLIAALLSGWSLLCLSCAKQEVAESADVVDESGEESPAPQPRTGMTVSVGIVQPEGSKVEVTAAGKVTWSVGDHIAIFVNGEAKDFELISGAGSENAVFHCDDVEEGTLLDGVAVYPYKSDLTYNTTTGALKVYIPAEQRADVSCAPMLGSISSVGANKHFFFYNLSGIFEFTYNNVPPEAKMLKFTSSTYNINGVFTLSSPSDRLTTATTATSGNSKVTTVDLPAARPDGTATVQVPVPAGTYENFTVALCKSDGTVIQDLPGMPNTQKSGSRITAKANVLSPIKAINLPEGVKIQWIWDNEGTLNAFAGNVPAIDAQGNVYVLPATGQTLYKLDANGQKQWSFSMDAAATSNLSSPSLEDDGSVVYVCDHNAPSVYAVNASSGTPNWKQSTWPAFLSSPKFERPIVAVGSGNNVYVAVTDASKGTLCTLSKSNGDQVSYAASESDGTVTTNSGTTTPTGFRRASGIVAISAEDAVAFSTYQGTVVMKRSKLDNPGDGKFVQYCYNDLWPYWGDLYNVSQGFVFGRKGPSTGKNVLVSCVQEGRNNPEGIKTGTRYDVYCSSVTEALACTAYRQEDLPVDDSNWHAYWRYQFGGLEWNQGVAGNQDFGGIVLGHDDLQVLLPMKSNEGSGYETNINSQPVSSAGIFCVWMDRNDSKAKSTPYCWRFNINTSTYKTAYTHSVESVAEVSGSPAVDNNGWVHVGSHDYYHIFSALKDSPYTITYKSKVNWVDLLNASGYFSKEATYADAITSAKIGDDGRIYFNLNVRFAGEATDKGVVVCLTHPNVTGTDPTSSWPQKGADARNSCRQVTNGSFNWRNNSLSWD